MSTAEKLYIGIPHNLAEAEAAAAEADLDNFMTHASSAVDKERIMVTIMILKRQVEKLRAIRIILGIDTLDNLLVTCANFPKGFVIRSTEKLSASLRQTLRERLSSEYEDLVLDTTFEGIRSQLS